MQALSAHLLQCSYEHTATEPLKHVHCRSQPSNALATVLAASTERQCALQPDSAPCLSLKIAYGPVQLRKCPLLQLICASVCLDYLCSCRIQHAITPAGALNATMPTTFTPGTGSTGESSAAKAISSQLKAAVNLGFGAVQTQLVTEDAMAMRRKLASQG